MAAPVWPAALPQDFQIKNYLEVLPDVVVRTKMDAGPDKVRRRLTQNTRPVKHSMVLTDTQYVALASFFLNDCQGGALAFTWNIKDPVLVQLWPAYIVDVVNGIVQLYFRFTAPPQRKVIAGEDNVITANGVNEVSIELEIMP